MTDSNEVVLGYWAIRGLAQPIRMLLCYVGAAFKERRYKVGPPPEYNRDDWFSEKQKLGMIWPNLPYLFDGDLKIVESNAILRHLARKHNMYGKSVADMANIDIVLDSTMSLRNSLMGVVYNAKYEELKDNYFQNNALPIFSRFSKWLDDRQWFVSDNVTVADFHIYEMIDQHLLMKSDILHDFANLIAFHKRFRALPAIQEYMNSPDFIERPCNNAMAGFK